MKTLSKSAITVTWAAPFADWHNQLFPEIPVEENTLGESTSYLVPGEFEDPDALIRKYFREIFRQELSAITKDEKTWPAGLTLDLFEEWFYYEISDSVVEL